MQATSLPLANSVLDQIPFLFQDIQTKSGAEVTNSHHPNSELSLICSLVFVIRFLILLLHLFCVEINLYFTADPNFTLVHLRGLAGQVKLAIELVLTQVNLVSYWLS